MTGRWEVIEGDVLDVMRGMPDASFDAVLMDPPYALGSREPTIEEIVAYLTDGAELSHGDFMGADWQVPSVAAWKEIQRVLKPGAHVFSFAGTRTVDLIMLGLRAGGFELRDSLAVWLYGSGYAKSLDGERAVSMATCPLPGRHFSSTLPKGKKLQPGDHLCPTTPQGARFGGVGTALKPAHENIARASKPLDLSLLASTVAQKLLEAVCLLPSYARAAATDSPSSRAALRAVRPDSALWAAVQQCSTADDLFALMGTWRSESEIPTSLSIAWSWLRILAEASTLASTFTIETRTSLTTDLRTLSCSPSKITPSSIIQAAMNGRGTTDHASLVESLFTAVASRLAITRTSSATASAISTATDAASVLETLALARKPLAFTVAGNLLAYETGGLDIDAGRLRNADANLSAMQRQTAPTSGMTGLGKGGYRADHEQPMYNPAGRFPSNVVLSHGPQCRPVGRNRVPSGTAHRTNGGGKTFGGDASKPPLEDLGYAGEDGREEVVQWNCEASCPVQALDAQAGERPGMSGGGKHREDYAGGMFGGIDSTDTARGDSGGASRFFKTVAMTEEDFRYVPKASRFERELGCEHLPARAGFEAVHREEGSAGLNPRAGAGRTADKVHNWGPCIKPVALTRWLAAMLLPRPHADGSPRRLLVPFCGTGSEILGGLRAGFDEVIGIQRAADDDERGFIAIARARLARWAEVPVDIDPTEATEGVKAEKQAREAGQLSLLGG